MFESKKAQIGEITHDFGAFLAACALLIIFFLISLFFINLNNQTIRQQADLLQDSIRMHTDLLNMLEKKVEIEIDNEIQNISFIDLVLLSQIDKKYEIQLKEIEEKIQKTCLRTSKSYGCYFEIAYDKCPKAKEKETECLSCILVPSNRTIAIAILNVYTLKIYAIK
ncbi:MAG: hypothetical protein QXW65_01935 [Candidatus Pacearchaeota archaeon]